MIKVSRIGLVIIALPTLLIIMANITNKILTDQLIHSLGVIMGYVDQILGTQNTNYILIGLTVILMVKITRWIFGFVTGSND